MVLITSTEAFWRENNHGRHVVGLFQTEALINGCFEGPETNIIGFTWWKLCSQDSLPCIRCSLFDNSLLVFWTRFEKSNIQQIKLSAPSDAPCFCKPLICGVIKAFLFYLFFTILTKDFAVIKTLHINLSFYCNKERERKKS